MRHKGNPFLFIVVAFLLGAFILTACEDTIEPETFGAISGRVIYADSDAPVVSASVTTNPPTEAVITEEDGTFTIANVPSGNVSVIIKKPGFKTETISIRVREGQTSQVIVPLSNSSGGSQAPLAPREPVPATDSREQTTPLELGWSPAIVPQGDSVFYDLILYESDSTRGQLIAENITDTTFTVQNLRANTAYFWQVIARDQNDNTTPGPVWSFRTSGSVNNRILFARNVGANFEIFSTDTVEGASVLRLTNLPSREWRPLLSPSGDRIAFTSNGEIETHIYTMTPEGRDLKRVTSLPVAGYHNNGLGYCWSPDGGELLYSHYDILYKIQRGGFGLQAVARAPEGLHWQECDWTAQGTGGGKIAALAIGQNIYNAAIYLMNADGTNMIRIVEDLPGRLGGPTFSPDGTKFLFTRDVSGIEFAPSNAVQHGRIFNSHIFLVDLATNTVTDLSTGKPEGTNDLMPRFSANGGRVIFVNSSNDGSGSPDVYSMNIDGTSRKLIVRNGITPSWN